jgi:hypothetical protein
MTEASGAGEAEAKIDYQPFHLSTSWNDWVAY